MTCWICPLAELSVQPPVPLGAALAVAGGPAANAAATTLATAARLDSLRRRLAFTTRPPFSEPAATGTQQGQTSIVGPRRAPLQVKCRPAQLTVREARIRRWRRWRWRRRG